jgi:hypothetical protein
VVSERLTAKKEAMKKLLDLVIALFIAAIMAGFVLVSAGCFE